MGVAWRPLGVSRRRQKQEVADVWPRAPATRLSSSWREEENDWREPVDWAELGQAKAAGKSLFSLSFSVFIYSIISVTSGL